MSNYAVAAATSSKPEATKSKKDEKAATKVKTKDASTGKSPVMPPFPPHMKLKEAFALAVHDNVDHRDQVGRFMFATVREKQGTNLKIHYDGWSRQWDTWSDFNAVTRRRAASLSARATASATSRRATTWT